MSMTMRIYTPTTGVWDGFETKVVEEEGDEEECTDEEEGKAHTPKVTLQAAVDSFRKWVKPSRTSASSR